MNSETPHGLSLEVHNAALPIRDALVASGWAFGAILWDNESERKLAFTAKSSTGIWMHVACGESQLVRKLQTLLDSKSK